MQKETVSSKKQKHQLLALSVAALGVVYGDIGTSPLYAINEIMFGPAHLLQDSKTIIGVISLVIWSLTLIVSFKYIVLVLRADSDGEGGVFALYSLLYKISKKGIGAITILLILAAGLLFGDGIITPAISVLSAVEGLKIATAAIEPYIIYITIAILTGLFLVQKKGTAKVGIVFGPIVIIWFIAIALLGLRYIIQTPEILLAANPLYAINFVISHNVRTLFLILGSVMLVLTGGEAMYADMGHFGRSPIRLSWFALVYPALLLNYLGQGAYLLGGNTVLSNNVFYSLVPAFALIPMVILATLATIIASQALISGAFSLASQAMSLGLSPFLKIVHTHHEHEGQIYINSVNWALYIGCVILVFTFQSSSRLAAAYGLAVSGVMFMTSIAMIAVARYYWKWSRYACIGLFGGLGVIDLLFLSANSLKFLEGGFIPLGIGVMVLLLLTNWRWGRSHVKRAFHKTPSIKVRELIAIKKANNYFLPRTVIVMTPDAVRSTSDNAPILEKILYDRQSILPKHLIFLTVLVHKVPYAHTQRYVIHRLYESAKSGTISSIELNYGFMEEIDLESMLEELSNQNLLPISEHHKDWVIEVLHERIIANQTLSFLTKLRLALFRVLARNAVTADQHFGLGNTTNLSVEILPVRFS